jgi:glucose/mannose-6-phosphate isomerase
VLPELDHNEVVGWPAARELGRFAAVFLEDPGAHPRNILRSELTAEQAAAGTDVVERIMPRGQSPTERLISHVLLGDLVSLYLAVLRGEDPVAIAPIEALKAALALSPR